MCSVTNPESILYSSVFALQSGLTLASITFRLCQHFSSPRPSPSLLMSALSSLFQNKTCSLLVIGVLLHVFSLLSSSFVEEEHQTWYFFTPALFVVIFLEKIASCNRKNFNDTELPDNFAIQEGSSEEKKTRKYREEKSFERCSELRNASFNQNSYSSGKNVDGLCSTSKDNNTTGTETENAISYQDHARSDSTPSGSENEINEKASMRWQTMKDATSMKGVLSQLLFCLVLLALGRLSRSWNQTGIKWADRPDIGDWLVKPENRPALSLCYFISLVVIAGFRYNRQNLLTTLVFIIGVMNAYVYRTVTGSLQLPWIPNEPITKGIRAARLTYCCVATIGVWNLIISYRSNRKSVKSRTFKEYICEVCGSFEGILSALLLLEILLQRPHNITLLAVFVVQEHFLTKMLWKR